MLQNLGVFLEQSELAQTLDRGRRDALIQDIKIICNTESIASASIAQVSFYARLQANLLTRFSSAN